jgi:hypothetical protein
MREMKNAYNSLLGTLEGKIPLGRSGHRWEDNTRIDLKNREWGVFHKRILMKFGSGKFVVKIVHQQRNFTCRPACEFLMYFSYKLFIEAKDVSTEICREK